MVRFCGVQIERKTDILAFAAFVMAIGSLVVQLYNMAKGSNVEVEGPRLITFYTHQYAAEPNKYLGLTSELLYFNTGSPGYSAIVKEDRAMIIVGNDEFEFQPKDYVDSSEVNGEFTLGKRRNVIPKQLKSGSIVAHETLFLPWPNIGRDPSKNYISVSDFVRLATRTEYVQVDIYSSTHSGEKFLRSCKLNNKQYLKEFVKTGWASIACMDSS